MKTCTKCKEVKELDQFYKCSAREGGLHSQCKSCKADGDRSYRNRNVVRLKIKARTWKEENRDKVNAIKRKYSRSEKGLICARKAMAKLGKPRLDERRINWRKRNKEKTHAHGRVQYAIRIGKLIKQPCMRCGCDSVDAHHEDYSRPLEVMWLCRKCHGAIHRIYKD